MRMEVHEDEVKGKFKEAAGRVQDAYGDLSGDPYHDVAGKEKQAEGKMEQTVGKVKKALHNAID
jgi:uncharacterized protein YjbJ (UPF0337 family)